MASATCATGKKTSRDGSRTGNRGGGGAAKSLVPCDTSIGAIGVNVRIGAPVCARLNAGFAPPDGGATVHALTAGRNPPGVFVLDEPTVVAVGRHDAARSAALPARPSKSA